jgi:hypothetical protein
MTRMPADLESERELLGSVHAMSAGLASLADTVEFENQHFFERLQRVEVRQAQLEQVMQKLVGLMSDQQRDDWWRGGGNPNG